MKSVLKTTMLAFGLCMAQNRIPAASKAQAFDEAKVSALAELLGL